MSDFSIKTTGATTSDGGSQSFLHEAQQEGKAQGKVDISHLDEAIDNICHIINEEAVEMYNNTPEEAWPTSRIACYSPKAEAIVTGKIVHSRRGRPAVICDQTGSKHIVRAREDVLIRHFHLDKETKSRKRPEEVSQRETKPNKKTTNQGL